MSSALKVFLQASEMWCLEQHKIWSVTHHLGLLWGPSSWEVRSNVTTCALYGLKNKQSAVFTAWNLPKCLPHHYSSFSIHIEPDRSLLKCFFYQKKHCESKLLLTTNAILKWNTLNWDSTAFVLKKKAWKLANKRPGLAKKVWERNRPTGLALSTAEKLRSVRMLKFSTLTLLPSQKGNSHPKHRSGDRCRREIPSRSTAVERDDEILPTNFLLCSLAAPSGHQMSKRPLYDVLKTSLGRPVPIG